MDGATSATAAMAMAMGMAPPKKPDAPAPPVEPAPAPPVEPAPPGAVDPSVPAAPRNPLTAAARPKDVLEVAGVAMEVPYRVLLGGAAPRPCAQEVEAVVQTVFRKVKETFSHFVPTSEVSALNRAGVGRAVPLSGDMREVLTLTAEMHAATDGAFDPTVGVLAHMWLAALDRSGAPPAETEPEYLRAKGSVGFRDGIELDGCTLKKRREVQLDLCGVAKGYCVDGILAALAARGWEDAFVDWGGDVGVRGRHPAGRAWQCGVESPPPLDALYKTWSSGRLARPSAPSAAAAVLDLPPGSAVATSGDYCTLRKFGYHHICCPKTARPLRASPGATASATVCHRRCMVADAAATHLMLLQAPEKVAAWVAGWNAARADSPDELITDYVLCVRGAEGVRVVRMEKGSAPAPPQDACPAGAPGDHSALRAALRAALRPVPEPVSLLAVPNGPSGCLVATASSVAALESGRRPSFYFAVMQGSLLHTRLRDGGIVTVHTLRGGDRPFAQRFSTAAEVPYGELSALPGAAATDEGGVAAELASDRGGGVEYPQVVQLAASARPCRITAMRAVGDHTACIAEWVPVRGRRPAPTLLLYSAKQYLTVKTHGAPFEHGVVVTTRGVTPPAGEAGVRVGSLSFAPPVCAVVLPATARAAVLKAARGLRVHILAAVDGPRRKNPAAWFAPGGEGFAHHPDPASLTGEDIRLPHTAAHIDLADIAALPSDASGWSILYGRVVGAAPPSYDGPPPLLQLSVGGQPASVTPLPPSPIPATASAA